MKSSTKEQDRKAVERLLTKQLKNASDNGHTKSDVGIDIGIKNKERKAVTELLTEALADTMVLTAKTRKFHWNVTGIHFMQLHLLFDTQYNELSAATDEIAERIRSLGELTIGSLKEVLERATLKENNQSKVSATKMLQELTDDHEAVIRSLRKKIDTIDLLGDTGTADFLTGLLENHEKTAWFLRSHLG